MIDAGILAAAHHPNLTMCLDAAVPLRIAEYQSLGGPTDEDRERLRRFSRTLAEKGDVLLYGSKRRGEAAELFNALADALAVLAFFPGGVRFAARHWQATAGESEAV